VRLRRNLLFNRFENGGAGGGSSEGGASGVDRLGIMAYDPESGEVRERAFDNPMSAHKYFDLGSIKCFISTDLHSLAFLSWKLLLCSPSIQARVFFDAITIRFNYFCCRFVFCLSSGHSYGFREAWDGRKIVYICAIKIKNKLQLFSDKQLHC